MKLDSHINKIENTSKSNKNGESSLINNKTSSKIPYKKNHKRKDSLNSFFSIKSTNIFNRHKIFLDDNFRDTKSDNNIDLYSPDCDNINKFDIKSISNINNKNSRKNVKDSLSTPKKKYPLKGLLKIEKKYNKHVSLPILNFNLRNHRRSASTSTPIVSPVLSKITSHLKSSINLINNRSNSNRFNDKINYRSSETASLSNLPITTTMVSTPMSLPAVVRKNSASTIEPPVMASPSTPLMNAEVPVNEPPVVTSSTTPLMNSKVPIYNLSYGRYSHSTPSLSYPTPDKTPSYLTPNSSKSTPSAKDEIIHSSKSLNQSTQSLQQTFVPKISTSPLISSEFESESKKKINRTRTINHQSIASVKNASTSSNIKESNLNTNKSCPENKCQIQEMESSLSTLNSKKEELSNKNQEIKNINRVDMYSTGCTNTSNTNDDKVSELKEDINEGSSTAIINKDNTTYSLFMPKSVIEKGSLQNSMQKEINGIIEYYDQSTLNEFSSIDPNKEDIPAIGNKLLLTYLNKNFENRNNEIKNGTTSESNINENNQSETVYQENSQIELDNTALKEQKIYISDIDIACLDINKIKGDISKSISVNDKIPINDSIAINPVTISSLNNILNDMNNPHVVKSSEIKKKLNTELSKVTHNQVILNPSSSHNEGSVITTANASTNVNTNTHTNINYDTNNKKSNNYNDSYLNEKINHQTLTKLLRGDETTNSSENTKAESGINNKIKNQTKEENSGNNNDKKENNVKKPYINVRTSSCPKNNIIKEKKNDDNDDNDKKIENEIDENNNKSLIKNENKIVSPLNLTQIITPDFPNKPIINHYKHQSQPQQLSSSYIKHYHHFSEGFENQFNQQGKNNKGNTDDELFKEEVIQIESLNSLKTALLFLSKNEANSLKGESSNKIFDSGSSLFSKRKSTNIVSTSVFNSNGHNRKYLSLPTIFSSSNHNINNINNNTNINNIILPLTTTEEGKLMYPVDRLNSGRKLRAYYGIECPILLSDNSKSKVTDINGTPQIQKEPHDKEKNESFDKKKNSKFVKRLTSFLHLGNNTSNNDTAIKDNKKKFKNNDDKEITKKEECAVEYVPVPKDSNESNNNLFSLYNNQGEIIPIDHFNNIQSNNNKIIVPVKNARTTKDIYGHEIKNISDLIKFYDKDSEIYSSREFSYKDSFSYTHNSQSITKNPSVYTKDETKTTFSMIPSRLRNVITTPSYKISFCDTEPYLSSFSFEHSISEYSSSESSFDISNHQINIKKIMARTSTTTSTQNKVNKTSILDIKNGRPLDLDNSYNIQKIPDTEEEINEDNIQFTMAESINEQKNNSFNDICKHSSSKIIDSDIDSLFLYPSNINELPDVALPKQEIRRKIEKNKNRLNENINTSLTEEEIKSTLFKDLYDKSLIKDSMMSNTTTTSYSYDSYDQSDNLMENSYSFLLDEIYNGKSSHKTLKHNNDETSDSESSSDEDYNFYDPPKDMDYSDNYLETRKKKFKLKKPIRSKNSKFNNRMYNSNNMNNTNNINNNNENRSTKPIKTLTKENDNETTQHPSVPIKCKSRTSSLDANISKDQPSTSIPDKKNVKTTTTTRTTTTIYKHPNEAQNNSNNQPTTKNKYSIKNTETKTTIIEEEDEDDGYSSSMSITSINTELMISVTAQPKPNLNNIKIPNIGDRKSSLSTQSQPINPLVNINNNKTIILSDANTEKIIKSNSNALSKEQKNIKECPTTSSYNDKDVDVNVNNDDDKNNTESIDIESDIDVVMKGDKSDYDLNLEEDDDDETQSISLIKNHIKNSNTLHQNLIIERKYNKTQKKESNRVLQHLVIPTKDTKLFEKQNIFTKNDKESLLSSSLYSHHSNSSTSSEDEGANENKSNLNLKNKLIDGVNHLKKDLNENNYYYSHNKLPFPYSQSISSSLSSIPISGKYEKEDNFDNYSYSLSSYSQSDYYEETDTEYSFISNNVKLYHRQKAKRHTKNDKNVIYQKGDGIDELNYQTERNNEEYCSTEILSYDNYLNKPQYNNETFDIDKIENPEHYHNLLSKFLLELLKNKCSEYFFLFHDMIQFQYKEFQCCDQFTSEGQEIFNTYLTNTSTLKINLDTKLVHKIAYGIKYYDRCCFIPLINIVLKILESKYLKYGIHQSTSKDSNNKNRIMQEYCKVLDEHYSSNINSVKILTGEESPNQIYKNMLIRKKVYDFCKLIFGKDYFKSKKSEGYAYKLKIVNFSEKLLKPTIK